MKYLRKYNTHEEYDADYYSGALPFPHVCLVDGEVVYSQEFDASKEERLPLYIEAIEDLTIYFTTNAIQYSLDNSTWIDLAANEATPTISAGGKAYFRASGLTAASSAGIGTFNVSGRFNVRGNIMSMAYGAEFIDQKVISKTYQFYRLFYGQINLVSANGLVLPATRLASYCYYYMFARCLNLTQSPECLPATYTYSYCYSNMFYNCTSLVNAPKLSGTYAAEQCYSYMFQGCTSLVNAPAIHLANTAKQCCYYMFSDCTSVVNAPALPAVVMVENCYGYMFSGCTSLVNAPALPATTLSTYCYQYMFSGCTSLVNAPALPATTLSTYCYQYMFYNCTSLVNAPALPATTLSNACYYYMFSGCTSLVNAPALPATTLMNNCYSHMFQNCANLVYIKAMFTTTPSSSYTPDWVSGVAASGTFVKNSAATWEDTFGTSAIPSGWTVETADA